MIVWNILGMVLWLWLIPFGLALLAGHRKKNHNGSTEQCFPGTTWIVGYILMFALLEIVGIPVMLCFVYHGFSTFCKIYAALLLILASAGIVLSLRDHTLVNQWRSAWSSFCQEIWNNWENRILFLLVILLIGFQLYMSFFTSSFDGDDAYYGVQALTAQQIDTLYRIDPNNGKSTILDARHALALFPIWEAFIGTMCGMHATIVAHSIVPLVMIPLSYLLYNEIAKKLFPKKPSLRLLFLFFMALWQMFGNVSIYTTETFFLTRTWQGKSFAGNFILPAVFWLYLCLFANEETKTERRNGWFLLATLHLAAGASSSLAVLLSCLLAVGLGVLFWVKEKRFSNLLYAGLSCIPGGLYVLLYLLL